MKTIDNILGKIERFIENSFYLMTEGAISGYNKRKSYQVKKEYNQNSKKTA